MIMAVVVALVAGLAAAPADVTGKWEGKLTMEMDGAQQEDSALLILTQKGDRRRQDRPAREEREQRSRVSDRADGDGR